MYIRIQLLLIGSLTLLFSIEANAIQFEETTALAGITHADNSFGISWGDVNSDGYPDAFLTNHFRAPSLFLNQGNGRFVDVAPNHELTLGDIDQHGAAWGDYDNDGDQDLVIVNGGNGSNTALLMNNYGHLEFQSPLSTGANWGWHDRTPTWLDEDGDGRLDLVIANKSIKTPEFSAPLFVQIGNSKFELSHLFQGVSGEWVSLINGLDSPLQADLLFNSGKYFKKSGAGWQDISTTVFPPGITTVQGIDYAYGDVNGDGFLDMYVVREGIREQVVVSNTTLAAGYKSLDGELSGFDFKVSGPISIYFGLSLTYNKFRLGQNEIIPPPVGNYDPVVLDSLLPEVIGAPNIVLGDSKVWMWYTPADSKWHLRTGKLGGSRQLEFHISANQAITDLTTVNINTSHGGARSYLYLSDGSGGFLPDDKASGISFYGPSRSAVFADFDNDMDLDFYVVNRNAVDNVPNQLFSNDGLGNFTEITSAGGAPGSMLGSGESVSVADYDQDGFIDLFVTNGRSDLRMPYPGPHQLYHNVGNGNHWLEIDLIGVTSTQDGIGAVVEMETAGTTQIRFQDGGMHAFGQHHPRVHFGLGQNQLTDILRVRWPSGIIQEIYNLPGDQLVQVREPTEPNYLGQPNFKIGITPGVFIWKDTANGPFRLRVIGDSSTNRSNYVVTLLSSEQMISTVPKFLNSNDDLELFDYGFRLNSIVLNGKDGVDFEVPSTANVMISVEENGISNPRQIKVGASEMPLTPVGWILDSQELSQRPNFNWKTDIGFFVGNDLSGGKIEFRWTGDVNTHHIEFDMLSAMPTAQILPVRLETGDTYSVDSNYAHIDSETALGQDGLDVTLSSATIIGFSIEFDALLASHRVNHGDMFFRTPNAYWLQ